MKQVIFCKFSNDRAPKFRLKTSIYKNENGIKTVLKTASSPASQPHVMNMLTWQEQLSALFSDTILSFLPSTPYENGVEMEYLDMSSMEEILLSYEKNCPEKAQSLIYQYISVLLSKAYVPWSKTNDFVEVFGDQAFNPGTNCLPVTNIDLSFTNIFINDNKWNVVDLEWTFSFPIPVKYIIYRALFIHFFSNVKVNSPEHLSIVMQNYGITLEDQAIFQNMERHFQEYTQQDHISLPELYSIMGKPFVTLESLLQNQHTSLELQEQNHTLCLENEQLQIQTQQLHLENEQLQIQTQQLHLENKQLQIQTQQLHLDNEQLQIQTQQLHLENEQLQIQTQQLHLDNEQLQIQTQQLHLDNEQLQIQTQQLHLENEHLQEKLDNLERNRQQQQTTKKKLYDLEFKINEILHTGHLLASLRSYKLAHVLSRTRNQFVRGNRSDKIAFLKWLLGHGKRDFVDTNHAYNPLFSIIDPLARLRSYLSTFDMNNMVLEQNQLPNYTMTSQGFIPTVSGHHEETDLLPTKSAILECLSNYSGEYVCILPPVVDFYIELFQRPQQIALALSSIGIMSIYVTPNHIDKVETIRIVQDNLLIVPDSISLEHLIEWTKSKNKKTLVEIYSTDIRIKPNDIYRLIQLADAIVYEYIDEISETITGTVPKFVRERHQMILRDQQIPVLSTANKLHKDVIQARNGEINCTLSSNGVDLDHFQNIKIVGKLPADFARVVARKKPIIGYFGAIDPWFDFDLVREAALARPNYEFALIGFLSHGIDQCDIDSIKRIPNITLCDPIEYKLLPQAAVNFTIATIPFLVNETTKSTSPVMIFEYMAMGKPVVTTDMPECYKYPVYIASNSIQYIDMLDQAIADTKNQERIDNLLACANENPWASKAMDLVHAAFPRSESKIEWLFLSAIDWDFRYQRPQQLATALANCGDHVTYFNTDTCDVICHEKRGKVDLVKLGRTRMGLTSIFNMTSDKDAQHLFDQLDEYLSENQIRTANVIVEYPTWYPLAKRLKDKYGFHIFFDYIDEYNGFTHTSTNPLLKEGVVWLEKNSQAIFATSQYLYNSIGKTDASKYLIRNATESARFLNARRKESKGKPVVGYYGAIADWFDTSLIIYAAKKLPEYQFKLIGDYSHGNIGELKSLPNVEFTGEVPYDSLTEHLRAFDVCLIPFDASLDLIKATNPVKFYEYLSAGKLVVATEIPELMPYRDKYVLMSNDPDGFTDSIRRCIENRHGLVSEEERIAFGLENDWRERVKVMRQAVCDTYPKVSVIVLTWNNANYNIACIRSIYDYSAYPNLELIVVDNASTDDTPERLRMMASCFNSLHLILNSENFGFAVGMNQGIRAATGEYIVILNNDTIVTAGWLSGMRKYLEDEGIGAVGSVTNSIGNEAKVSISYDTVDGLQGYAAKREKKYAGKCFDIKVLALFCTMLKRSVIDEIGFLDEQFKVGMFEDDDYSLRLQKAGYRTVCARDVFIHHYGGSSFKKLSDKRYQEIFNTNKKLFEQKHGQEWQPHVYATEGDVG